MAVTHTFIGLPVASYTAAHDWYVRLLGREADMFPHETECAWRLTSTSSIFVVEDLQRAGSGLLNVALDDLDAQENRLRDGGFTFTEKAGGTGPRRLVLSDTDGNRLVFFHDPTPTRA